MYSSLSIAKMGYAPYRKISDIDPRMRDPPVHLDNLDRLDDRAFTSITLVVEHRKQSHPPHECQGSEHRIAVPSGLRKCSRTTNHAE